MEKPFGLKERTALYPAKSENSDSDTVVGLIDRARCSASLGVIALDTTIKPATCASRDSCIPVP